MARLRRRAWMLMVLLIVPIILFGDSVVAQSIAAPPQREAGLDEVFVFRAVLSGLCLLVLWLARKADSRMADLEKASTEAREKRIEGFQRLGVLESRSQIIENDNKQLLSMVNLLRELLVTKYEDKEQTEKHWLMLNKTLEDHRAILRGIQHQIEQMSQRKPGEERRRS